MHLASLAAVVAAALVMVTALATPADACRWKKAGYHGYRTADAGAVVGYKHRRHHKRWKYQTMK
jgi:hypothetical protein